MSEGGVAARDLPRHVDLALAATLLSLVLSPIGTPPVRAAVLTLAGAGLLIPRARRTSAVWLALAALAAVRVALDWPMSDNHAYLIVYWCLAAGLALRQPGPEVALAWNGRVLVGAVFALATLWKLATPEFVDGTFFRVTFVTDPRFEAVPRLLGGLGAGELDALRAELMSHVDAPAFPGEGVVLPRGLDVFARLATVWTLAMEAAIAAAFLAPPRWAPVRLDAARDLLLAAFCAATYLLATVAGFAWLLLAMALAASRGRRWAVTLQLAVFALVLVYREASPAAWLLGD